MTEITPDSVLKCLNDSTTPLSAISIASTVKGTKTVVNQILYKLRSEGCATLQTEADGRKPTWSRVIPTIQPSLNCNQCGKPSGRITLYDPCAHYVVCDTCGVEDAVCPKCHVIVEGRAFARLL